MTRYIYWSFIYKITLCVLFYSTSTPIQFFFTFWMDERSLTLTSYTLLFMYKPNGKFYIYAKKRKESLCRYIVFFMLILSLTGLFPSRRKKINKKISFLFSNFHFFFVCLITFFFVLIFIFCRFIGTVRRFRVWGEISHPIVLNVENAVGSAVKFFNWLFHNIWSLPYLFYWLVNKQEFSIIFFY